jgi:hypothetical protein
MYNDPGPLTRGWKLAILLIILAVIIIGVVGGCGGDQGEVAGDEVERPAMAAAAPDEDAEPMVETEDSTDVAKALQLVLGTLPPELRGAGTAPKDSTALTVTTARGSDSTPRTQDSTRIRHWSSVDTNYFRRRVRTDSVTWLVTRPNVILPMLPYGPTQLITRTRRLDSLPFTLDGNIGLSTFTYTEKVRGFLTSNLAHAVIAPVGGNHSTSAGCDGPLFHCPDGTTGSLQFSMDKWLAKAEGYSPAQDFTLDSLGKAGRFIGNDVMDEPHVSGTGDEAGARHKNTWGPAGTMTKARVDSLCAEARTVWPNIPTGVSHSWNVFEPTKDYAVCDFTIEQYSYRLGNIDTWLRGGRLVSERQGTVRVLSMNVLNGGTQDTDGTWDCKLQGGLKGTGSPNCAMTPAQIRAAGFRLISEPGICALMMWRYDDGPVFTRADFLTAHRDVADSAAKTTAIPCRRRA